MVEGKEGAGRREQGTDAWWCAWSPAWGAPSPGWGSSTGGPGDGQGGVCTRGGGKLEGDSLVRDAAHVSYRHLAGVAGIVLGPQILQLQDLGLPLGSDH